MTRYLFRGRERETGTYYSSPSAAMRAADSYRKKVKNLHCPPAIFVINPDGEYIA
jgi:hypothetical protein